MVVSKAESQRNYYQRKLAENREEFLKKRKEIKERYYKKTFKKEIVEDEKAEDEIDVKEFIILKPLTKRVNSLNTTEIKEQTKKIYLNSLNIIYKKNKDKDIEDDLREEIMKLLSNEKYNTKLINEELGFIKRDIYEIIKSSKSSDIRNLYSLITRIRGFTETIKQLYPYIEANQTKYNEKRVNKTVDVNVANKMSILSFKKEEIIKILKNDELKLTSRERLLFSLFTLFPTRRAIDYNRMLISKEKPKTEKRLKLEQRNNYYYDGEFYFNITKNKEIQHYAISDELKEIIETEIKLRNENDSENENNKYLLLSEDNKPYNSPTLSFAIMKVFKKIYGIAISAVEIRRLYSTYLKDEYEKSNITEEEHRRIAEMMNHSYDENKKYAY
jgi:hypothetical protein